MQIKHHRQFGRGKFSDCLYFSDINMEYAKVEIQNRNTVEAAKTNSVITSGIYHLGQRQSISGNPELVRRSSAISLINLV